MAFRDGDADYDMELNADLPDNWQRYHFRAEADEAADEAFDAFPNAEVEMMAKEQEIMYKVVRWSSQKRRCPASNIQISGATWESASMCVTNEFVVLELLDPNGPMCLTGVEIALPGDESGPRHIAVHYSKESADGPWVEAWQFSMPSKEVAAYKSVFNYNHTAQALAFVQFIAGHCGGIEEAWTNILDTNHDGNLSFTEFIHAVRHVHQLHGAREAMGDLNMRQVFDVLTDGDSEVSLASLRKLVTARSTQPLLPKAPYWKITARNNFGSMKRMQIVGPVRVWTTIEVPTPRVAQLQDLKSVMQGRFLAIAGREHVSSVDDKVTAFDVRELDVSSKTMMARRLSKKHDMSVLDVEELHRIFTALDVDGSGGLEEPEFKELILRLYGMKVDEIPASRLRFFWQTADANCSGEVDFEECLEWFQIYGQDLLNSTSRRNCRLSSVS